MPVHDPDPLDVFTAPPLDETEEQKVAREAEEAEAKRVNDLIDEGLKKDKAIMKKESGMVKILLLGQAESGKSTTLKNFRFRFALEAWKSERSSWRAVIQLNLIRSINVILEALEVERRGSSASTNRNPHHTDEDGDDIDDRSSLATLVAGSGPPMRFTELHALLMDRLTPLRQVETNLEKHVGAAADDAEMPNAPMYATPFDASSRATSPTPRRNTDLVVKSWKHLFERNLGNHPLANGSETDEATELIFDCRDDMLALWKDRLVQVLLNKRLLKLADSAEYFLNRIERIATRTYEPSDDDVIRARLRTVGVQEHRMKFDWRVPESGSEQGQEWAIYDVGGSRTQRAVWRSYFDNVNAIIFLAPISCFDEFLQEDPSINRLQDSFILWKSICESKLLSWVTLIVFMNKCDLLQKKLKAGVSIKKSLPSFGDRENNANTAIKYLRQKFREMSQQLSPPSRSLYVFGTSATDSMAMISTLKSVRDGILRDHLRNSGFM